MGVAKAAACSAVKALLGEPQGAGAREATLAAIAELGQDASPLASSVALLLSDDDRHVREEAVRALQAMGPCSQASFYVGDIALLLQEPFATLRAAALRALGAFGPAASAHASDMLALLSDPRQSVRAEATRALQLVEGVVS